MLVAYCVSGFLIASDDSDCKDTVKNFHPAFCVASFAKCQKILTPLYKLIFLGVFYPNTSLWRQLAYTSPKYA